MKKKTCVTIIRRESNDVNIRKAFFLSVIMN